MIPVLVELAKPRLVSMVLVSSALGYFLGAGSGTSLLHFLLSITGIALAGAGASALNQYIERDVDTKMERTKNRPLPLGRIAPLHALAFGITLTLGGIFLLAAAINLLSSFLVLLTAFLYVLVYTPLKRLTWLNTTIGAIPGAIPTLAGWAASAGELSPAAWSLFAILFLWQHPHFFAIAWLYRNDYRNGEFKMLPVVEPDGASTFRQVVLFTMLLIAASLAPAHLGKTGIIYLSGAAILGITFLAYGIRLAVRKTADDARALFHVSLVYLPCLVLLLAVDTLF